jgi:hypothetical protein
MHCKLVLDFAGGSEMDATLFVDIVRMHDRAQPCTVPRTDRSQPCSPTINCTAKHSPPPTPFSLHPITYLAHIVFTSSIELHE